MGIGFSLGTGFFSKAVDERDKNKEEEVNSRRFLMQHWSTNVLPQIQKQRQVDDVALAKANSYLARPEFQAQPERAFHAARSIVNGDYKDIDDYLTKTEAQPGLIPPGIKEAQLKALSEKLSYNTDPTGRVSNFSFKPEAQASTEIPGANAPRSLAQIISGKRNMADSVSKARNEFTAATGVDPTQGTSSKFNSLPESGTLSVKTVDQQAKDRENKVMDAALRSGDVLNMPATLDAFYKGGWDAASKVMKFDTVQGKEQRQINAAINSNLVSATVRAATETGNPDLFNVLSSFDPKKAMSALSAANTPEQKMERAKLEAQLSAIKGDAPDWMKSAAAMAYMAANPSYFVAQGHSVEEAKKMSEGMGSALKYYSDATASAKDRLLSGIGNGGTGGQGLTYSPGGATPPPTAESLPPGASAATVPPPIEAAPKAAEGFKLPEVPGYKPPKDPNAAPSKARLGESANSGDIAISIPFRKSVEEGNVDVIAKANPIAVLDVFKSKGMKPSEQAVKALTFKPSDVKVLMDNPVYRDAMNTIMFPLLKEYASHAEAAQEVDVGKAYRIKGQGTPYIATDNMKSSYSSQGQ